ncbi:MAG: hypothetical protein H6569_15900, partial [Lewinellaceae bacterium]|nr:hypothetical protein [Lewinellaceae bacterium]
HQQYDLNELRRTTRPGNRSFYEKLAAYKKRGIPFFIAEFKRQSPSEGWINRHIDLATQVRSYADSGAAAISVLTDSTFFGGSYADLQATALALDAPEQPNAPLLLQKDFILDPIQIYLARRHGADIILLIAAALPPEQLLFLKKTAEQLGMGVLVEVHNQAELDCIQQLDFPVLGINNRDLKTFRTALNRTNVLARQARGRFVVAESGIRDYRDFQVVRNADGFLIGTSLMAHPDCGLQIAEYGLAHHFGVGGNSKLNRLFKACGIRTPALLNQSVADFVGLNFSPVSQRQIDPDLLTGRELPAHAVAVFYKNTEAEIREVLARFPFRRVQLYTGDVTPEFVRSLKQKVLLACRVQAVADLEQLENYAADVDLFILDGAVPGSGQPIDATIPVNFPYPFLLAGGMNATNLERVALFPNCIGVDIASGIETDGAVDMEKIKAIERRLREINQQPIANSQLPHSTPQMHQ